MRGKRVAEGRMAAPKNKQWYMGRVESLQRLLDDVLLGVLESGDASRKDAAGGEALLRSIARLMCERLLSGEVQISERTDPEKVVHEYMAQRIQEGTVDRETVRVEKTDGGRLRIRRDAADCQYAGVCRALAEKGKRVCVQRVYAEQLVSAATGRKMSSEAIEILKDGACVFEIFPAGGETGKAASDRAKESEGGRVQQVTAAETWRRLEAQYRLLLETIADAIVVVDNDNRVTYVNPRACGVFGMPAERLMGASFEEGGIFGRIGDLCVKAAKESGKWEGSHVIENREGERVFNMYLTRFSPIFTRERSRVGTMVVLEDITREEMLHRKLAAQAENLERIVKEKTRELQEANAKLEILARTDSLTGLPNRRTFEEILRIELQRASRYRHSTGVIMVDVDDFKQVNDRLGHQTGDLVLKYVASILSKSVRASDTVARWGGDEFILLLPQAGQGECTAVSRRIGENLLIENASTEVIPGLGVGLSVGWSTATQGNAEDLVASADKMMYERKAAKKARTARDDDGTR